MASVCPRDCHPNVDYSICTVHTLHHMHTSNWHFFNFILNFINSMPLNSPLIFWPALSFPQSDLFRSLDILFLVLARAIGLPASDQSGKVEMFIFEKYYLARYPIFLLFFERPEKHDF